MASEKPGQMLNEAVIYTQLLIKDHTYYIALLVD